MCIYLSTRKIEHKAMINEEYRQDGLVLGLHHITLVTSNEEVNRRFYTEVLGLRRVKLTVNQDDIFHRHLFYANERGETGSAITFFEWPDLPKGTVGLTSPHHLSYAVKNLEALPKWRSWLLSQGISVVGPLARLGRVSLYLRDPDGVVVEITKTDDEQITQGYVDELNRESSPQAKIGPEMRLASFDHASPVSMNSEVMVRFLNRTLGLKNSSKRTNPDDKGVSIVGVGNDEKPDFLRYLASPGAPLGEVGAGSVHHIAMAVADESCQQVILRRLNASGVPNSGVVDRFWFKSLYFRDPDGNLLEIATEGPGYTADEPPEKLGSRLVLAPWLEPRRNEIEGALNELDSRNAHSWPPSYPGTPTLPEALDHQPTTH
jgi:glyoxalase family protein